VYCRRFLQRSIRNYVVGRLSVPLEDAGMLVGFTVSPADGYVLDSNRFQLSGADC
jgi:hypothetical protein